MLLAAVRLPLIRQAPRALAVLVFLYFLSAFIQSGYVTPTQMMVGGLWLFLCYLLSQRFGVVTGLALSFSVSVLWGMALESIPVHDSFNFNKSAYLISTGDFSHLFISKSAPTVAYYAVFHLLLGSEHVTSYIASAAAWTGGAAFVYRAILHFIDDRRLAKFITFGLALCPHVRDSIDDAQLRGGIFSFVVDLRLADVKTLEFQRSLSLPLCDHWAGHGRPISHTNKRNRGACCVPFRNRGREGSVSAKARSDIRCIC